MLFGRCPYPAYPDPQLARLGTMHARLDRKSVEITDVVRPRRDARRFSLSSAVLPGPLIDGTFHHTVRARWLLGPVHFGAEERQLQKMERIHVSLEVNELLGRVEAQLLSDRRVAVVAADPILDGHGYNENRSARTQLNITWWRQLAAFGRHRAVGHVVR